MANMKKIKTRREQGIKGKRGKNVEPDSDVEEMLLQSQKKHQEMRRARGTPTMTKAGRQKLAKKAMQQRAAVLNGRD